MTIFRSPAEKSSFGVVFWHVRPSTTLSIREISHFCFFLSGKLTQTLRKLHRKPCSHKLSESTLVEWNPLFSRAKKSARSLVQPSLQPGNSRWRWVSLRRCMLDYQGELEPEWFDSISSVGFNRRSRVPVDGSKPTRQSHESATW